MKTNLQGKSAQELINILLSLHLIYAGNQNHNILPRSAADNYNSSLYQHWLNGGSFSFWQLHSPIKYFNLASRSPPPRSTTKLQLIWFQTQCVTSNYNVRNLWVEVTLENRIAMGECTRAYKYIVKLTLDPYGTLES